jgi:hypothetical protein
MAAVDGRIGSGQGELPATTLPSGEPRNELPPRPAKMSPKKVHGKTSWNGHGRTIERCCSDATWQKVASEYAGQNLRSRSSNG